MQQNITNIKVYKSIDWFLYELALSGLRWCQWCWCFFICTTAHSIFVWCSGVETVFALSIPVIFNKVVDLWNKWVSHHRSILYRKDFLFFFAKVIKWIWKEFRPIKVADWKLLIFVVVFLDFFCKCVGKFFSSILISFILILNGLIEFLVFFL